ncbi:hypothetical protein J2T17_003915 [Paenibacillus mucilaginosus]|uniref:alginate lyase family protein n=1 Tax=Paenibacillus mucilaginosus TaxID=61624 RepID=UPI003D1F0129
MNVAYKKAAVAVILLAAALGACSRISGLTSEAPDTESKTVERTAVQETGAVPEQVSSPRKEFIFIEKNEVESKKLRLAERDAALLPGFQYLMKEADKALGLTPPSVMDKTGIAPTGDKHDYWSLSPHSWPDPAMPGGMPYKEIPDAVNSQSMSGDYDKAALSKMTEAVNTLALAYYYTGDERYAHQASLFLKTWFLHPETRMNPNLNFGQTFPGRNGGGNIIDAALLIHLPDSLLMLEGSPSWTQQDDEGVREWMRQFSEWMMSSEVGRKGKSAANNHSTWFDVEYITFLLATGQNQAAFHHLQDHSMRLIDLQIDSEGRMPNELNGPKAFHHSLYNLKAFSLLAAAAEHVGVDLWHYQGSRGQSLNAAYSYMAEYLLGKPWPYTGSRDELKSEVMSGMIAAGSIYDTAAVRSAAELLRDKAGFKLPIYGVRGF